MSYTLNYRGAKIDELLGQVDEQFIAEYNVSLYADITAAIAAGKQVLLKKDNALYPYIGQDATSAYTFAMVDEDAILQLFTVSTASVWATVSKALQEELTLSDLPGMTVGASDNLISDAKISNSSPYLYRPVINGVGNRAYSKLIGATIANNQLVQNGNFADGTTGWNAQSATMSASNNILTVTPSVKNGNVATDAINLLGHYYYLRADIKLNDATQASDVRLQLRFDDAWKIADTCSATTSWQTLGGIVTGTPRITGQVRFLDARDSFGTFQVRNCELFDLTAMFGSTIADYAYTLEQGQAGSGVAWLKSYGFFGKYAPYDAGSLISTKAEKKKVVGFNLWDEEWENGYYNTANGNPVTNANYIRSKNPIKVFPNTTYCFTIANDIPISSGNTSNVLFYDVNGNYLSCISQYKTGGLSQTFTTPANAEYVKMYMTDYYGNTYKNDICINLSKTTGTPKNGDYLPYTSQEYDLGSDELRGLFKLDNGNLYADGDIKTSDGTITRKYAEIDLGSLTWGGSAGTWYVGAASWWGTTNTDLLAENYIVGTSGENTMQVANSNLIIRSTATPTGKLIYKQVTPTTEQGTPFIDPSIVYPNGTEEYIDTRTVPVPVGNDTEYTEDLKGGLETILDTPPANGTYVLKATVSGGVATLSWVSE